VRTTDRRSRWPPDRCCVTAGRHGSEDDSGRTRASTPKFALGDSLRREPLAPIIKPFNVSHSHRPFALASDTDHS
jgi:hypothetical protein